MSAPTNPSLSEAHARYAEQRRSFDRILDAARRVDAGISGTTAPNLQAYKGAVLFTKALAHSIAIDKISPQVGAAKQLYDVSSGAVLTRALAEAYLAFRYFAVEPTATDDSTFRVLLAEYHRRCKQFKVMRRFGITDVRLEHAALKLEQERAKLKADPVFLRQTADHRKRQLDGERSSHRTLEEIAEGAAIHRDVWGSLYGFLSQFAHSSPMAIVHLANFRADQPVAPSNLSMMLQVSSAILAKFILDIEQLIPASGKDLSHDHRKAVELERQVLENMLPDAFPEPG